MALCLIIEDQPLQRKTLVATLKEEGHQVVACGTGEEGCQLCLEHRPEMVLLDLGLPDADGIDLIPQLLAGSPLSRILVLTGRDSVREAVAALRAGARHYLVKPWDREELLFILKREMTAVNREENRLRQTENELFWGVHPRMKAICDDLGMLSSSPSTPVLLCGETGTGKELVARELHRVTNPQGDFVALNCAAVPHELMESELFGHQKGAFTGADARKRGVVELANEGTLLLDEIGEMAVHLQAKLLRFLQDGSFRRLGGEQELVSRCRIIGATHVDLEQQSSQAEFRQDLYYRLAVVTLTLPPLRDRDEDVLPLTHFLIETIARRIGRAPKALSPRAEEAIREHRWPGNVRELANRVERAMVLGHSSQIEPEDLDLSGNPETSAVGISYVLRDPHRLRLLLDKERWNVSKVARRLGVERHKVKYRINAFGLRRPDKK